MGSGSTEGDRSGDASLPKLVKRRRSAEMRYGSCSYLGFWLRSNAGVQRFLLYTLSGRRRLDGGRRRDVRGGARWRTARACLGPKSSGFVMLNRKRRSRGSRGIPQRGEQLVGDDEFRRRPELRKKKGIWGKMKLKLGGCGREEWWQREASTEVRSPIYSRGRSVC